jgi:hypothetical protein
MPGHDEIHHGSQAVCLNQNQCEHLCEMTPGCHSIDMHKTRNRCFLNTWACDDHIRDSTTVPDANYDVFVMPTDENMRRLMKKGRELTASQVRQLRPSADPGHSWGSILRFQDVVFHSGGEFKLCFCDSDLLDDDGFAICDSPEDFTIEVGTVHSTGLQCLLSNPKMTRATCAEQRYGGLRCYDGDAPTVEVPTEFLGVPDPSGGWSTQMAMLAGFCQFAAAEETGEFRFCDQWRTGPAMPDPDVPVTAASP